MAAGPWQIYDSALRDFFNGVFDLDTDTFGVGLLLAAHTPLQATHDTWSDVSADECADGDYAQQALSTPTITIPTAGTVRWDAADITFGDPVTITAKYAVIVRGTPTSFAGPDLLVAYCDLDTGGGSLSSTAGAYDITINASGIFEVSQSN